MATSTTQIMPDEFTEFVGSSSEDQAYAKVFWQSITLHPPIESRLVSGDIRQRLPVAKPKGTYINKSYKPIQKPPKLTKFLHVSHGQVLQEESLKLMKQAQKREEDLQRLRKRKEERAEVRNSRILCSYHMTYLNMEMNKKRKYLTLCNSWTSLIRR
ncbi:cilia- and flagella-associated protein HOATZ-like [Saccoglossus kowalevskii]